VNYNSYKLNTEKEKILEISNIPQKDTEEYNKVEFLDFFDFVHHILSRKNLVDNKILDFINKQLVVQS